MKKALEYLLTNHLVSEHELKEGGLLPAAEDLAVTLRRATTELIKRLARNARYNGTMTDHGMVWHENPHYVDIGINPEPFTKITPEQITIFENDHAYHAYALQNPSPYNFNNTTTQEKEKIDPVTREKLMVTTIIPIKYYLYLFSFPKD